MVLRFPHQLSLQLNLEEKVATQNLPLKGGDTKIKGTVEFSPKSKITERQYLMVDGALIAEDIYPERFVQEKYYMFHSVRKGSYAQRVGFGKGEVVLTIDGVKPTSIEHLEKLLSGGDEKKSLRDIGRV